LSIIFFNSLFFMAIILTSESLVKASPTQAEIDAEMAKRPERKDEPITILRWADGHFEGW
jgi:hypothetical protein